MYIIKHHLLSLLSIAILLTPALVVAEKPADSEYIDGGASKTGLILSHGRGKHPTWLVVEPLRTGVHESIGYHTLSLQMPNNDKGWKLYADDFPEAYDRIKDGIRYLKEEKGVTRIFLMGHSMGSRMASAFISANPKQPIAGLILAGCRNNGDAPLSCIDNLQGIKIPVLDIWGGNNNKDVEAAADRQNLISSTYSQVEISGANHKFESYEDEFVSAVVNWLKNQK